jgi:putative transposase
MKLAEPTLESMPIERPEPTRRKPQNMCMDKGYDFPEIDELIEGWGYTGHISRRGDDQSKRKRIPGYRARRWVVERTHSWLNRFSHLLINYDLLKAYLLSPVSHLLPSHQEAGSQLFED